MSVLGVNSYRRIEKIVLLRKVKAKAAGGDIAADIDNVFHTHGANFTFFL